MNRYRYIRVCVCVCVCNNAYMCIDTLIYARLQQRKRCALCAKAINAAPCEYSEHPMWAIDAAQSVATHVEARRCNSRHTVATADTPLQQLEAHRCNSYKPAIESGTVGGVVFIFGGARAEGMFVCLFV
jgi:hypothetical protein